MPTNLDKPTVHPSRQLSEMQGRMEAMMRRSRDQDEVLRALTKAKAPGAPSTIPTKGDPITSSKPSEFGFFKKTIDVTQE